jgi:hypothetical protein
MRDKKLQTSESTNSHIPNELQPKSKKKESGKRLTTTKGSEDNNMKPLWPLLSVMSLWKLNYSGSGCLAFGGYKCYERQSLVLGACLGGAALSFCI